MEEDTIKISHVLFMIFMMIIVIIAGTYAWFSYRSNKTAMVLTIGEINNVQVTLSPYQIKASLFPQVTYMSDNYTSITAINNSSRYKNIRLYYKINSIDNELISSDFKYTIERSTDGTTYSQYQTGNFSSASNGVEITILEESIPNNTTYNYKVYLWIDGSNSGQSYMQGKSFNGELRADVEQPTYTVTFKDNLFDVNSSNNFNGLTIDYDNTTSILTINGSTSSGNPVLSIITGITFNVDDIYDFNMEYLSGTVTGDGTASLVADVIINSNGTSTSPRNNSRRNFLPSFNGGFSQTIDDNAVQNGIGFRFWLWLSVSDISYTFNNYKVKVEFYKKETKEVTYGSSYGELPTPTRSGYTFLGWHGVNLLENTDTLSGYSYPAGTLDMENTFDGSYSVKTNRAWLGMYINLKELYTQNKIKLGDQLTYSVYAKTNFTFTKNTTFSLYRAYNASSTPRISISPSNMPPNEWKRFSFTFNVDETSIESTNTRIEADYYVTDDPYYFGNNRENYIWFTAPQLEFGNESTPYELFYITEDSIVVQNKNHTLTAIWQKN